MDSDAHTDKKIAMVLFWVVHEPARKALLVTSGGQAAKTSSGR